ncbi:RHS repeat-associated core domain-containing protein [Paracoccus sp. TOH]|uniref:RHS repeat-associated core domain-containing protein n=1 Tax=Paracoccus sp. TOH TaxID=1263728 RepID=UPI0025B0A83E|nr:RHS repeat-associated core domain-containing protein [Paracoccus sp. TOH]
MGGWLDGMTLGAGRVASRRGHEGGPASGQGTDTAPVLSDYHQQAIDASNAQTGPNGFEQGVDSAIATYNSDAVQNTLTVAPVAMAAAYGAGTAMGAGLTGTAVLSAAATAAAPAAAAVAAGMVAGFIGFKAGEALGGWAMEAMGFERIAEDGEMPATVGHPIAHVSGWSLGAMVLGAVAAVAVGVLVVATAGAALGPIMLAVAAASAAGLVGGIGFGFASVAGQYGTNKGTIKTGSANVWFRNKPVARVNDIVDCSDHAVSKVAEGAETVFANNWPIARIGHKTTCDGTINDGVPNIAIDIDTSAIALAIDVGWQSRLANLAVIAADLLPIGGRKPKGGDPSAAHAGEAPNGCRTGFGCPVDVATGRFMETRTDIAIPGTIPLVLQRTHAVESAGIQGKGWAGTWAQQLRMDPETVTFQNDEGTLITFHTPGDEVMSHNLRFPHLELLGRRSAELFVHDRRSRLFLVFADEGADTRRLSRIEDRNGNRIAFLYGPDGLRRVEHSDGFALAVHSAGGLIRHAVLDAADGEDCVFAWDYNRAGQLVQVRSSQTGDLRYDYDEQGRLTGWHDVKDTHVHYEYGADGRIRRLWSDSGHAGGTLDYDVARRRTVTRSDEGAVTVWDWTEDGVVWRETDPTGQVWLTEWDRAFHVTARVDPLGGRSTFAYDVSGNLIRATDAEGAVTQWDYGPDGLLRAVIDPAGNRSAFRHDGHGNLVGTTDALNRITSLGLGAKGEVLRIDMPGDVQERIFYDPLMRPDRFRDPDGNEVRSLRDTEGRLLWTTDQIGAATRFDVTRGPDNPRGNVRAVERPDGAVTRIEWDAEGQLSAIIDPDGNARHYRYGAFDLPLETVDAKGHRLRMEHDREMRLTAVVNERGERYEYRYDAAGRVVAERDYSGLVTRYTLDAAGRVILAAAPDGSQRHYDWSPSGRLMRMRVQDGQGLSETRFAYDQRGLLVRAENGDATVEYDYDALGRVVAERLNGREIASDYDLAGQRIARSGDVLHLTAAYSRAGLPVALTVAGHQPLSFRHDPRGLEQLRHSEAGFALSQGHTLAGNLAEQIAGPFARLPEEARLGRLGASSGFGDATRMGARLHRSYAWDRLDRATAIHDRSMGSIENRYDARGQVTARLSDKAPLQQFEYDPARNLAAVIEAGVARSVETAAGRVRRRGNVLYRHDDCGRVIEKRIEEPGFRPRIWRMEWDGLGQLVGLETPEGRRWRYRYDPFGRRVARLSGGQGAAYQWEGDRLIAEAPLAADGSAAWQAARHWVYEPGSFRPLAQVQHGALHYIVTDHIGTPREMFSEDGAEVVWRAELSLWGEIADLRRRAANDDAAPDCPIRFQGQFQDPESGLHYNRFRYYDPDAAQYLAPDPIGLEGGFRPQGYVADPNGWVDPLGLNGCGGTVPHRVTVEYDPRMPRVEFQRKAQALQQLGEQGLLSRATSPVSRDPSVTRAYRQDMIRRIWNQYGERNPAFANKLIERITQRMQPDHVHELQLNGPDAASNLRFLDSFTNWHIGTQQIWPQIRNLPPGTPIVIDIVGPP